MFVYLLQGIALALPTTLTPSPFKVFILSQALESGFRRTWPVAFAPLVTDGPIILLVVWVLTQMPPAILTLLQIAGGFFLLYLAARMLRSVRAGGPALRAAPSAAAQNFRDAIILNVLNPNPYIFWGVVAGPIMLQAWTISPWHAAAFVFGFYATFVGGLLALVAVFAQVGRLDPRITRALVAVSSIAFALIGLNQIVRGVQQFM